MIDGFDTPIEERKIHFNANIMNNSSQRKCLASFRPWSIR